MRATARDGGLPYERAILAAVFGLLLSLTAVPSQAASDDEEGAADGVALYLVTLRGPGTAGHRGNTPDGVVAARMLALHDAVLASVGAGDPVYRWTTALNGVAVELTEEQATALVADDRVALVEENVVHDLADAGGVREPQRPPQPDHRRPFDRTPTGGAGVVIGFVDTGIDPDSPAFFPAASLTAPPRRFRGNCTAAPEDSTWAESDCSAKIVGAQYFVEGFGSDEVTSSANLSPRDSHGHGTEVASIAAGASDVSARFAGRAIDRFSGVAPQSHIAVYKACWTAPDPSDDGCASADLVAGIDQAVADGVDVLNLAVTGPSATIDTVERALLGAAEAGVVVTAAAGNDGTSSFAAHPVPWVMTVGASDSAERVGAVTGRSLSRLTGAMAATAPVGPALLVRGADVAADGVSRRRARVCAPDSLDAGRVRGRVVLCERGVVPRVAKSAAVKLADGVGMVLINTSINTSINTRGGSVDPDLHAVPTVHLPASAGRALLRWAERTTRPVIRLSPVEAREITPRLAPFSSGGDPTWSVMKPDLVAPGTGILAASAGGWRIVTGTSAATAHVSGLAADLLARGADPAETRSALMTSATPDAGPTPLRAGAGHARPTHRPAMAYLVEPRHFRGWLNGHRADLNLPQALMRPGRLVIRRTITNTGSDPLWITARRSGFHSLVQVSPAAGLVRPGKALTFTLRLPAAPSKTDSGYVEWRSGSGDVVRLPVVITR